MENIIESVIKNLQIPITGIIVEKAFVSLTELGTWKLLLGDSEIGTLPYQDGVLTYPPVFYSDDAKIDWNKVFELEQKQIKESVSKHIEKADIVVTPSAFQKVNVMQNGSQIASLSCYYRDGSWVVF